MVQFAYAAVKTLAFFFGKFGAMKFSACNGNWNHANGGHG
jgi:hypothetical protein